VGAGLKRRINFELSKHSFFTIDSKH
jgi:hypothetical protein